MPQMEKHKLLSEFEMLLTCNGIYNIFKKSKCSSSCSMTKRFKCITLGFLETHIKQVTLNYIKDIWIKAEQVHKSINIPTLYTNKVKNNHIVSLEWIKICQLRFRQVDQENFTAFKYSLDNSILQMIKQNGWIKSKHYD